MNVYVQRLFMCTIVLLFAALILPSCDIFKEDDKPTTTTATVEKTYKGEAFTKCFECHGDTQAVGGVLTVFGDSNQGAGKPGWLNGPHANNETVNADHSISDNHPGNDGFPYYGYSDLGLISTCTLDCHDQLGQGKLFASYAASSTGSDALGSKDRPIVACASCHGDASEHIATTGKDLEYNSPGPARCSQCHNSSFGHQQYHPEGGDIFEDYSLASHASSINDHNYVTDSTTDVRAKCSRCHTDEGARKYTQAINNGINGTATYDEIGQAFPSGTEAKADIAKASVVQCRTCHDSHNPHRLLAKTVKDYATLSSASGLGWSDQFITCTSCHQLLNGSNMANFKTYHTPVDETGTVVNAYGAFGELIVDTHYDIPTTTIIEGYVVDPKATHSTSKGNTNSGACLDCHNQHAADLTINRQWAKSAHGGQIATVKATAEAADVKTVYAAGVDDTTGVAWAHYDFKGTDRASCQRCHTSTGFRNFANDAANYDPATTPNEFIATGEQREMLYCWACHIDNKGGLRDPGVMSDTTLPKLNDGRVALIGDIGGSNICVSCHSGRASGQEIHDSTKTFPMNATTGTNFSGFNSHYLTAGGTLYRTTGYEYTGHVDTTANYDNKSYFAHIDIGTVTGTGSEGPCVGCHMTNNTESHTFNPFEKDATGAITAINTTTCAACHALGGDYEMTVAKLNTEEEEYHDSLAALKAQLAVKGIYHGSGYPYFFTTSVTADQTSANAFKLWDSKNTLGAAFNLNLLAHEPGGFAHNRYYVKRLIYDSIDWLDDGLLNASVSTTLATATHTPSVYVAGATAYLLSSTNGRP